MKIRPDELQNGGFVLMDTLHHLEIVPFVGTYMKKRTIYSAFYIRVVFV